MSEQLKPGTYLFPQTPIVAAPADYTPTPPAAFLDGVHANPEHAIAEMAREFCAASMAYDEDPYGSGWMERITRRDLARAALFGACGFLSDWPETTQ